MAKLIVSTSNVEKQNFKRLSILNIIKVVNKKWIFGGRTLKHKEINKEESSMQIILHSGNAKSDIFDALKFLKDGDQKLSREKCESAQRELVLAEKEHASLLRGLAESNRMDDVDLLLVHAEGHLSAADVAVNIIKEIIEIKGKL